MGLQTSLIGLVTLSAYQAFYTYPRWGAGAAGVCVCVCATDVMVGLRVYPRQQHLRQQLCARAATAEVCAQGALQRSCMAGLGVSILAVPAGLPLAPYNPLP